MSEIRYTEHLPDGVPQYSLGVNRFDMAVAARRINEKVERGYGPDGMPLQPGQSPMTRCGTRDRAPKNAGGEGSGTVTLEEQRAGAISGRAWKAWDGQTGGTRAEPSRAELAAEKERLSAEIREQRNTIAELSRALARLKADKDRLRLICLTVLESAFGEDWETKLREVQQDGTDHDGIQGDAGAAEGE